MRRNRDEKEPGDECGLFLLTDILTCSIIPFSTVVDREKARRCPFYAPSGFLYEIGNVVWAIYPEIFLNFLFRTLGR